MFRSDRWRVVAMAVLATALLAGCAEGESPDSTAGGPAKGGEAAPPAADQGGAPAPAEYRRQERAIIYTGEITVRVDEVDPAATRALQLAEAAGGFVAGDRRSADGTFDRAQLTLRVPADRFMAAIDEIGKLGREESRNLSNEDVTQQVVDLDAQIASQKASVERTRALLARATSVAEIVSIEGELAKRESALATLEARKRRLADLTSLSTVTVHLLGPAAVPTDDLSFLAGLRAGWKGFVGTVTVLLAVLGFVLPFLVALGVPAAALVWVLRRRRRAGRDRRPPVTPARQPAPGPGG